MKVILNKKIYLFVYFYNFKNYYFFLVTVFGDFVFQIIRKDNRKPIEINVLPKMNNTYRIQFQPSPVTSYILKALPITTN